MGGWRWEGNEREGWRWDGAVGYNGREGEGRGRFNIRRNTFFFFFL